MKIAVAFSLNLIDLWMDKKTLYKGINPRFMILYQINSSIDENSNNNDIGLYNDENAMNRSVAFGSIEFNEIVVCKWDLSR